MLKKNLKRNSKKKVIKTLIISSSMIAILTLGVVAFLHIQKNPNFLSPLPTNYKIGLTTDSQQAKQDLEKFLKENRIEYTEIQISNKNIVINLKDKSRIILSASKNLHGQIASLQFILARLTMEGKAFKELDLRFDKPIIRQ